MLELGARVRILRGKAEGRLGYVSRTNELWHYCRLADEAGTPPAQRYEYGPYALNEIELVPVTHSSNAFRRRKQRFKRKGAGQ